VQAILWVYCVNHPALVIPFDIPRRFGFGFPVGLLVDSQCAAVMCRALGEGDASRFVEYARAHPDTRSRTEYYESLSDLTDVEILATWNPKDGPIPGSVTEGFIQCMASLRATREVLAWAEDEHEQSVHAESRLKKLDTIDGWDNLRRESRKG
jgi:hypothetical protein